MEIPQKHSKKADKPLTGWIAGVVVPPLAFVIIWLLIPTERDFAGFITYAIKANVLSKFMSLAVLPNLLVFFIFIWAKMDRAAKGVLYATFILAIVVIAIKFLM